MLRSASISRNVLSDQVKDHLLQAILAGVYPPGSRIVETRVARGLGISQAPVREALRDLEALGVVEITAFQGARVRRPTKAELLDAYGVRAELKSLGARLALPRMLDADFAELQDHLDALQAAATAGDAHEEARVDVLFHSRLIEIAGNQTLERVWRYLEPMSRTYITLVIPGMNPHEIADLHHPILAALREGDAEKAEAAVRRHFLVAGRMFADLWLDPEAEEPPSEAVAPVAALTDIGRLAS